jgi:hypothetical protein
MYGAFKEMKRKTAWREGGILLGKKPSHRCDSQHVPRGNEEKYGLEKEANSGHIATARA